MRIHEMTRATRLAMMAVGMVLACLTFFNSASHVHAERPHIVFFFVDDLGWQDLSEPFLYRDDEAVTTERNLIYRTPAIERLAARGVKFTQAYAEPVCSPTRVSVMTGKNAAEHHVTNWVHPTGNETTRQNPYNAPNWRRQGMAQTEATLPNLLRQAGYRTVHLGKAHFGARDTWAGDPTNLGFEVNIAGSEIGHPGSYRGRDNYGQESNRPVPHLKAFHGTDTHLTDALTIEAGRALAATVEQDRPAFIHLSHYTVHAPFQMDPRFADNYPTLEDGRITAYATLVEGMDGSLGQMLATIDELGIGKETLVVFASDNGGDNPIDPPSKPLRGKKGQLYEGGIRIPMIIAWAEPDPDHPMQQKFPVTPGTAHHGIVHIRDLFATLLAVGGAESPVSPDSFNLADTLRDPSQLHLPQTLLTHFPHGRGNPNHRYAQHFGTVYRDGPWKLIYNYETHEAELYNLDDDLGETNNLAGDDPARTARMIRAMRQQLDVRGAVYPRDQETDEEVRPRTGP